MGGGWSEEYDNDHRPHYCHQWVIVFHTPHLRAGPCGPGEGPSVMQGKLVAVECGLLLGQKRHPATIERRGLIS